MARHTALAVRDGDHAQAGGLPFDLLLAIEAAQLAAPDGMDHATPRAAAIRPAIGEDAHPFAQSPLLVETALAFASETASGGTDAREDRHAAATPTGHVEDLPPHLADAVAALLGTFGVASSASPGVSSTPSAPAPSAPPSTVSATVAAVPVRAHAEGPLAPNGLPTVRPAPPAPASAREPAGNMAERAAPSTPAKAPPSAPAAAPGSTLAVHWLPVEGGVRLLVRLARLPDELRAELETRLRELFGAFGLTLRDLDFHETSA
ncbi:MAG: hypothetical protein PHE36_08585 [Novosphingobium sp.]|nr:hypothetical protein [Novosphingobium sp.]